MPDNPPGGIIMLEIFSMKGLPIPAILLLGLALVLTLAGCRDIEGVHYLSDRHPANPDAPRGQQMRMSNSLMPETVTVRPTPATAMPVKKTGAARPMDHSMHQGMDHSMHRGSH